MDEHGDKSWDLSAPSTSPCLTKLSEVLLATVVRTPTTEVPHCKRFSLKAVIFLMCCYWFCLIISVKSSKILVHVQPWNSLKCPSVGHWGPHWTYWEKCFFPNYGAWWDLPWALLCKSWRNTSLYIFSKALDAHLNLEANIEEALGDPSMLFQSKAGNSYCYWNHWLWTRIQGLVQNDCALIPICICSLAVLNHLDLFFLSLKWSRGCSFSSSTACLTKKSGSIWRTL